jgi:hypothetical protein
METDYGLYASVAASHKTFVRTASELDRSREPSGPGPVAGSPHAVLGALSHLTVLIAPAARRGDAPPGATRRKGLLDSRDRGFRGV